VFGHVTAGARRGSFKVEYSAPDPIRSASLMAQTLIWSMEELAEPAPNAPNRTTSRSPRHLRWEIMSPTAIF
jgi:hypothetical protein